MSSLVRWLEMLAFGVFTYQQTQSAFWVASMTMLRMLPMALLGVAMGALAARIRRRRGLLVSHGTLFCITLLLLGLSIGGRLEVWHLAVAAFAHGVVWAGDNPMRRGLIGDIAGPGRMSRAMAIDGVANNGCRLAGPGIGGLLLAHGGTTAVLAVVGLLYLGVLAAVLRLAERPLEQAGPRTGILSRLARGFQAVRDTPRLAAVLWITMVFNLTGWPVLSMVPVIGAERLQLSTEAIGMLASMDGLGALLGAVLITSFGRSAWQGHFYVGGVIAFLLLLPVFAYSPLPALTGATLLLIGIAQSGFGVMQAALVYVTAPADRRLEAMGMLTMCIGIAPVGFVAVGMLAQALGASLAATVCAAAGLTCLALSWRIWRLCLGDGQVR